MALLAAAGSPIAVINPGSLRIPAASAPNPAAAVGLTAAIAARSGASPTNPAAALVNFQAPPIMAAPNSTPRASVMTFVAVWWLSKNFVPVFNAPDTPSTAFW